MDILQELKKVIKLDFNKKHKLIYAVKNDKTLLALSKIKLRSCNKEHKFLFKEKVVRFGRSRATCNLKNFFPNEATNAHSSSKQRFMSGLFNKGATKSGMRDANHGTQTVEEVIASNNKPPGTFYLSHPVAVKKRYSSAIKMIYSQDSSLTNPTINHAKIKKESHADLKSPNHVTDIGKDSSELSFLEKRPFVENSHEFDLMKEDPKTHSREGESSNQTVLIPKLNSTFEKSSLYSSNKRNCSSSYKKKINLKIGEVLKNSVEQYITATSSESDFSSCKSPILKSLRNHQPHLKLEKSISCSLSEGSRSIQDRSLSKESFRTITSTVRDDGHSYSCFSRSPSSSQLSSCFMSGSSMSRSPSIPRRYGSPSFLERRRITSARKRPIPYRRPLPSSSSSSSSSSNSLLSLSSRDSFTCSSSDQWSPESNKSI